MQKDSVYLAGGKPVGADASPTNGIVPAAVRDALIAAWKSGYYHHGYTNDSAYADQEGAKIADELIADQLSAPPKCPCAQCRPITMEDMRMILCPTCGNKRCPKASDHTFACTGSNEPGQPGSVYA